MTNKALAARLSQCRLVFNRRAKKRSFGGAVSRTIYDHKLGGGATSCSAIFFCNKPSSDFGSLAFIGI